MNTHQIERTVLSCILQDAELRNKLIANYPGITDEPAILFSAPEAIDLVPNILGQSGRYSSAMYASVLPNAKPEWVFDKVRFEATNQDLASFYEHTEKLRKHRKHERMAKALIDLQGRYKKVEPEDIDDFASKTAEETGRIAMSYLGGNVAANADEIDDALGRELSEGQKFKVPTGIEAIDYLTGGGMHISKNGGELCVVGGVPKSRKTSALQNLVMSLMFKYPDMRVVWISTEPAFSKTDIETDFINKIATMWMIENCVKEERYDFSHDDANVGRSKLGEAFQSKEKNAAIEYAVRLWRSWREHLRVFSPGIRDGNTFNFSSTMSLLQTEVEARGCDFIVIDRAQEWLQSGQELETMRKVTNGISSINAKYKVPIFIVSEYNKASTLSYGGAMEYALSLWLECRYNSKETPGVFEMEIVKGRHVGANTVKMEILPKSGLIGRRLSGY